MLQPVIIAGGSGTRLWPLSRKLYPKQFLPLTGDKTMLQLSIERLAGLECLPPIIVCNEEHRFIAAEQLRELGISHGGIILEPSGRDTAPAICLAALHANEIAPQSNLLVLPADHHMTAPDKFCAGVTTSMDAATAGNLITFGITPDNPATGYGYIKANMVGEGPFAVTEFVEKPAQDVAQAYLETENYLWNSGIFLFSSTAYLKEVATYRPEILAACEASWANKTRDNDFYRPESAAFEACPAESIDYAVMEHTDRALVCPMDPGWNDLGSWSALLDLLPKTAQGNVQTGDVISHNSSNNYIHADSKLVSTIGINDLVIVDTKDALLVAHRDSVEDVKLIVDKLKAADRSEYIHHREVYRPWGKYDSMDSDERFQVKRITVKPLAKLSVQMHHHRAEHWVVVKGTAKVTIDGVDKLVSENESVYIPIGAVHALENPGRIPIELIEIQTGSYLGEDDIVRFEDRYGRS
ncbi:mannose-1-phosphate guanylyltransferase/mannose-6-phosphate isomerase [Porticoccaceae bacterium]|nr:mannose-1-phosphate guanylyltransferase/mannose-6-phosphate isomerase [Porticoccaceae bacterium]MDB9814768.1 mannose-1-phosphate guanylyltransferase/mannose-6-phosphate isomerase [bacterium]MDB9951874.1 mannose-1-phosphate guanylyltransferase/mannose-6-phosphate isomerase [Porticoccaceae bacterium]